MTYKQIKLLILLIPTLTSATWEYVRHKYLLPYISMEVGNLLSPVIVFLVTMIVVVKLFKILEHMKEELEKEKAQKSILEERDKLSRELHDSIAQTLFLLSVKMNKLEKSESKLKNLDLYQNVKKTVKHVHEDVRQAIFKLRQPTLENSLLWSDSLEALIKKELKATF
jgi:two-component system nitrate/nitrite sensor histidine kinase NarQ